MLSLANIASIFGHAKCVHGATFIAAERSLVFIVSYERFLEHVHSLGARAETALRGFLTQSDNIGRETWSAYGSVSLPVYLFNLIKIPKFNFHQTLEK